MSPRSSTIQLGATRLLVVSAPIAAPVSLTRAEADVAMLVARGLSNAEIAAKRKTSVRTIANQVRAILKKLGVKTRRGVARALLEQVD